MKRRGLALWVVLLVACAAPCAASSVWVLSIHGEIDNGMATYIHDGITQAIDAGAVLLVLDIDTPGGLLDPATRCRTLLLDAEIPTVAYVHREAFSAGAMIAIACETILFAPGGVLGAATPVYIDNDEMREAPEKTISAVRTLFRAAAEVYGRSPEVAEAMVDRDVAVPGLIEHGKLLTLTSVQASAWGYSDGEISSLSAWLAENGLAEAEIVDFRVRWIDDLVNALTSPIGVGILITMGILGLVAEMLIPGFGIPGVIGIVCLGAFFWAHFLVGLAGWESIAFLLAGLVAILLEIFAFTAVDFGITGLVGLVLIGLGFYNAMVGPFTSRDAALQAIGIVSIGVFVSVVLVLILLTKLPKTRLRLGGMILSSAISSRTFGSPEEREQAAWVGRRGVAATDLRPVGVGLFGEERVDVVCEEGHIAKGTPIEIVKDDGYRKIVRGTERESSKEAS